MHLMYNVLDFRILVIVNFVSYYMPGALSVFVFIYQTDSILSYTALYNDTAIHSLPAVINSVSSAILKMRDPKKQIITYSFPWPCGNKLKWDGSTFSSALMIGLAFVLVAPGFAVTIVYETQVGI